MEIDRVKTTSAVSVRELIKRYPHVCFLGPENGAEITEFFERTGMEGGGFKLLMQRKPDYFDMLKCRGDSHLVLGLRDDNGKLIGAGTASTYLGYAGGEKHYISYMGDLRVKTDSREIKTEWKQFFDEFLSSRVGITEMHCAPYMYLAVIDTNERAKRVLLDRTYGNQKFVSVVPYAQVSLFARRWRKTASKSNATISQGTDQDLQAVEEFLDVVNRKQAYGYRFSAPEYELRRRLKTWPGFSMKDFFIARDPGGQIIAVTALWNPHAVKQVVVEGPWWTKIINLFLRPFPVPCFGQPLETVYLTHLSFAENLSSEQKQSVFSDMVDALWPEKRRRKAHMLAFCDFTEYSLQNGLQGYLKAVTPVHLYQTVPEEKVAEFDRFQLGSFPPAFEMALA